MAPTNDESRDLEKHLAGRDFGPGAIFRHLKLARGRLRKAFSLLQGNWEAQVNLASILSAARYKCFHEGRLHSVRCPNSCGSGGNFRHMPFAFGLLAGRVQRTVEVDFMVDMARRALTATRGYPELMIFFLEEL